MTTTQDTPITPVKDGDLVSGKKNEPIADELLFAPDADIFENEHEILIDTNFPGVARDALRVEVSGAELTLEGRRSGYEGWLGASRLQRTFRVPESVDVDGIEAELNHGVLRVRLPKRKEAAPRRISVRSAE